MKNQMKLLAFLTLALLSVKSYSQSGNTINITPTVKAQSNAFKNLAGQNRVAEFKALESLLVTISSKSSCAGIIPTDFTNRTELYNLLGTPTSILSSNLVSYKLSTSSTACEVTIGIDDNNLLLFTQINKCP